MGYFTSNHRTQFTSNHRVHENSELDCLLCGAKLVRNPAQTPERICLICRAAILDRVFQTRRQRSRVRE